MTQRWISYTPLASQKLFHESTARFKGFSGPIGSGKSQALCNEAIRLSYQNPGRLGLLGAPTYPMLRDSTLPTFFSILEENDIPYEHNKAENYVTMLDSRSRIVLRPVDEFERLRGMNLAWFGVDELTYSREEAWLRLEGRLRDPKAKRLCGFAVWTPKGYDWVYRRFLDDPVDGYDVIIAKPFENRYLLAGTPDFYERLKKSYDEGLYKQEVMGEYLNLQGGQAYPSFSRSEHVRDESLDPQQELLWALDFNVNPMSSVVAQIHRGHLYVLDEIVLRNANTKDACVEFLKRYPNHEAGISVFGDASGNSRRSSSDHTDYEVLRNCFRECSYRGPISFDVAKSNPRVQDRVAVVNMVLRNAEGEVMMHIDSKCQELIKDFEQVAYKQETMEIDKDKDRRRTHMSDALGYLIWQKLRPRGPFGPMNVRVV